MNTNRMRYEIDQQKLCVLADKYETDRRFPNPYDGGVYFYFVESLYRLGPDQPHSFAAVREQMHVLMDAPETRGADGSSAWDRFAYKTGVKLPCEGRIVMNAEVLQRVREYGLKLLQVGQKILKTNGVVVDILKGEHGSPMYRLNTDSDQPINEFRRRRVASSAP